jgi:WD40 repeat protein
MRRTVLLTTAIVLLAACQADDDAGPGPTDLPTPAVAPAPTTGAGAPTAVTDEPGGVRRFGDGRALRAAYDPAADRTVVATTIGLVVQAGGDAPVTLSPAMATMLAVSADGAHAAMTTSAGHLEVWDVARGTEVARFDVAPDRFTTLDVVGSAVVAASPSEVVRFAFDGSTTDLLAAPPDTTLGPAVVDDAGALAVPLQRDRPTVAVWSPDGTRADVDLGLAAGTRLTGVRWSGDGVHLAVLHAPPGSGDTLGIWDVDAGRFTGHVALPNFVTPVQVAFVDPDRVVLPNFDRVVAYDLTGTEIDAFPIGGSTVAGVDVAGGAAIVSRLDGTVTRWSPGAAPVELDARTMTLVDHRGGAAVTNVDQVGLVRTFTADGTLRHRLDRWAVGEATAVDVGADGALALATSTGAVRVLDPSGGAVEAVLDRPQGAVSNISITPERVATGVSVQRSVEAWDDTIEVTDLAVPTAGFALGGEAENVTGCSFYAADVVFSPDGTLLASTSHDFTVQVSPLDDPDATVVLEPHLGAVFDIELTPDGSHLLTSSEDGTMRTWAVDGWELLDDVTTSPGGWYSMAFSPDGALLAVSDADGRISIIDPATAAVERTFAGRRTALGDMVFTPDGRAIVAPEPDGAVGVWDVATGDLRAELRGHTMPVNSLAVSADGATVVTASQDGTVRSFPLPAT